MTSYGFPIGGVAPFDPDQRVFVSAGGVGFDVSCGVRTLLTGIAAQEINQIKEPLADSLLRAIPAGVGSTGKLHLNAEEMGAMLTGRARWAVDHGYGLREDLDRIEEHGQMKYVKPGEVSDQAKKRQRDEVGTLGSRNHYLEGLRSSDRHRFLKAHGIGRQRLWDRVTRPRIMRAAINCALANREVITHLVRQTFAELVPRAILKLIIFRKDSAADQR